MSYSYTIKFQFPICCESIFVINQCILCLIDWSSGVIACTFMFYLIDLNLVYRVCLFAGFRLFFSHLKCLVWSLDIWFPCLVGNFSFVRIGAFSV